MLTFLGEKAPQNNDDKKPNDPITNKNAQQQRMLTTILRKDSCSNRTQILGQINGSWGRHTVACATHSSWRQATNSCVE